MFLFPFPRARAMGSEANRWTLLYGLRSKQMDPNPKDNSLIRKETYMCTYYIIISTYIHIYIYKYYNYICIYIYIYIYIRGFHSTVAASFSYSGAAVRFRASLFATHVYILLLSLLLLLLWLFLVVAVVVVVVVVVVLSISIISIIIMVKLMGLVERTHNVRNIQESSTTQAPVRLGAQTSCPKAARTMEMLSDMLSDTLAQQARAEQKMKHGSAERSSLQRALLKTFHAPKIYIE